MNNDIKLQNKSDNSVIAKNTVFLYLRMIVILLITLYISRAILAILGHEDFGVYSVIGGVVILFSFLTNAMTSATQRYLNFHLGLPNNGRISTVFNIAFLAHLSILIIVFILSETIGLWFVETQINLPEARINAARWVYQMTVLASLINIIVIPYRASLIATERMDIFAILSVIEVLLKLVSVVLLPLFSLDNLILYSVLLAFASTVNFGLHWHVSRSKIPFSKYQFEWDKQLYKEMMFFSGYHLLGGLAVVGSKQGLNILINIFYNVTVNAAVGIANQVRSAVFSFVSSFQTAFNPQIVKLYASKEFENLYSLFYKSTKFSYYLILILSLPILVYCNEFLSIWLTNVPKYSVVFTQLVIVSSYIEALSAPLGIAIGATGKVKYYQIFVSVILLLDLPIAYIALTYFSDPSYVFVFDIIVCFLAYLFRLLYVKHHVGYSIANYSKKVFLPCLMVTILSVPLAYFIGKIGNNYFFVFFNSITMVCLTAGVISLVGLDNSEREFVNQLISKKISKLWNQMVKR